MLLNKTNLPASTRATSSTPRFGISENAQFRFNGFATKALVAHAGIENDAVKEVFIDWDETSRTITFGLKAKDFAIKPGDGVPAKIAIGKKVKIAQLSFGGSQICNAISYDYKTSGSQSFDLKESKGKFSAVLPTSLTAKPKTPRKPKTPAVTVPEDASAVEMVAA